MTDDPRAIAARLTEIAHATKSEPAKVFETYEFMLQKLQLAADLPERNRPPSVHNPAPRALDLTDNQNRG